MDVITYPYMNLSAGLPNWQQSHLHYGMDE